MPEGKRVLVRNDPANADYQQLGMPADAPIICCNAPHQGYLCARPMAKPFALSSPLVRSWHAICPRVCAGSVSSASGSTG